MLLIPSVLPPSNLVQFIYSFLFIYLLVSLLSVLLIICAMKPFNQSRQVVLCSLICCSLTVVMIFTALSRLKDTKRILECPHVIMKASKRLFGIIFLPYFSLFLEQKKYVSSIFVKKKSIQKTSF